MTKTKSTPKKSTTKKPSLVKRVVDKIIKPKVENNVGIVGSASKVETKSMDYDVVIINLCGNHKSYATKLELIGVGFSESELPAVGERKEFGRFTLVHISQDAFLIQ